MSPFLPFPELAAAGLNLQAVLDLNRLPAALGDQFAAQCGPLAEWTQLLLLGHAGTTLWQQLPRPPTLQDEVIDDHSRAQLAALFANRLRGQRYRLLYPSPQPVALQQLGALVGWHHASPLRVGVCQRWGSWFAYRALALSDTALPTGASEVGGGACASCVERRCVAACPAGALQHDAAPGRCSRFRLQPDSPCATHCAARWACPVAPAARYSAAQFGYHYRRSLLTLQAWQAQADSEPRADD